MTKGFLCISIMEVALGRHFRGGGSTGGGERGGKNIKLPSV